MTSPDPESGAKTEESVVQSIDAQTRRLAQNAGLDTDLESQVPPVYGRFTQLIIVVLLIAAIVALLFILF